ncbi:MAG: TonB-dependent receptor [Sphingopyxis sp.]
MRKSTLMVGSTLFAVAIATAQPAFAQDAPPAEDCVDANNNGVCDTDEGGTIVVTGTRIARPTLESAIPLTSVTIDDIQGTGEVSLGDALNDLPSLRSTFSAGNSSRFIGTAGLSLLDLRGLGTARTLVLINGRRHVTSAPGTNGFDVNTIPTDLVTRIDIVTGGNSAVYGSDAVAGVVNFILRRDFDGLTARAQGGISSRGDRGSYFASLTGGRNFADGRGNIAVSLEYTRQQPLYFRDRDALTGAFSGRCQFNNYATENPGGEPAAGDGIPDTLFFCGVKNGTISDGGTVGVINGVTGAALRFGNDGNLFIDTPPQSFRPISANQQGGFGSTLRNTGSLLAEVDRYAANLLFHYDFSDALRPFVEAKYVRTVVSGEGQPSFFQGSIPGFFGGGSNLRCNNPFLTASSLGTLQGFGVCTNVAAGTFNISRFNTDFGGRRFEGRRETYRVVAGINGDFNDDWNYELAVNYGRFEAFGRNRNNLLLFDLAGNDDGFLLALDAVAAPVGFTGTNFVTTASGVRAICAINAMTNVRPDCVPINVLGSGNADPRALAFSHADSTTDEFASQLVASANVSGDFSQLFELPGGPISFALGAEYRRERARIDYDELTSFGGTFLNALQDENYPELTVKEAYGELQFPLLENLPFARELVVTLAGRVSDYNNSTGTVYAYNIQGVYAPIEDVRLRVAYATSVRAPDQDDLFGNASQNFAFIADPCDQANINGAPNQVANCAAAGVPTVANAAVQAACAGSAFPILIGQPWVNCTARTSSTSFTSGGNPTLQEERGRSLTIGAVFEPSFLPGFNLTVDYYNIEVKQAIAALAAQTIISLCYQSSAGLSSPFCGTVSRDPATGLFGARAVVSGGVNFASFTSEGIDVDASYTHSFDNGHKVRARFIGTRVINRDNFVDPTLPTDPNRQRSELGDPTYAATLSLSYDFGNWDLRWDTRYIGRQTIGTYETQNSYLRLCPASGVTPNTGGINGASVPCTAGNVVRVAPNNADAFPQIWYPDVFYHDVRIGWDINDKFRFYAGVNNLFDRQPPLGLLGTAGGDPFDSFGRNFFFGISADL